MAPLAHPPARGVAEDEDGAGEDVEHRLLVGEVVVEEAAPHPMARVVDEHLDRPVRGGDPLGDPREGAAVGQVGGDRLDLDGVPLPDLGRHRVETVGVPCHDDEVVATRRELVGELAADARGGSGDEGDGHPVTIAATTTTATRK